MSSTQAVGLPCSNGPPPPGSPRRAAPPPPPPPPLPPAATRTGQALTVFLTLFFLFDSLPKLLQLPAVVEATTQMGFAPSAVPITGAVLLVCLVLYLVPRTAIL